jgi:hemin uptake protein HemP
MDTTTTRNAASERPAPETTSTEAMRAAPQGPVRVLVSKILAGGREAILEHDGQDYRLRITSNGKLILTK